MWNQESSYMARFLCMGCFLSGRPYFFVWMENL